MSGFDARLIDAFDSAALDAALWPIAIGVALVVGAGHALRPGHGKTLVAAYLVAERGRWRQAVALAVIVAGLHTVSVLVIGLVWWALAGARSIEPVAAWARLAAALLVLGVGAVVLRRQWRAFRRSRSEAGGRVPEREGGHGHDRELAAAAGGAVAVAAAGAGFGVVGREHDHVRVGHGDGRLGPGLSHAHHHEVDHHHGPPEGVEPWSWAGLFGIASAGALVPSPAAFLILVSGLLTGRAALAVVMVACFGIGLAATVLAVGLMVIAGRDWLGGRVKAHGTLARLGVWAPLVSAVVIVGGGVVLSAGALAAFGTL